MHVRRDLPRALVLAWLENFKSSGMTRLAQRDLPLRRGVSRGSLTNTNQKLLLRKNCLFEVADPSPGLGITLQIPI